MRPVKREEILDYITYTEKRNESQKHEAENSFDNNEPIETIGKSTDDDTIVNITI